MNVTRAVVNDLLPLYLAGEASADTRALLEEYLRDHPDFAEEVRRRAEPPPVLPAAPALPPDHEAATLERVRAFQRHRTHLRAFAIAWTLMPLTVVFEDGGVRWIMLRDNPLQAAMFAAAAVLCWAGYVVMGRRLSAGRV
jgi:hypothetical protein